jgi:cytoskeleton protein RodZ
MATVADQLKRAREAQQLNIYQVAEITKIKTDHIRALECGHYDAFSAPVYIRGFVRTYAKILKLDESQVVADLEAELGQTEKFREPPPLTKKPRGALDVLMLKLSRLNWRIAAGILAVAFVFVIVRVGYRTMHSQNEADPLKNLGPGLYQPKPDQAGELLPLPTNSAHR